MFKQITAFVLLVAIMLQILNRTVIYLDYYTNTAAYAKNCINKARPLLHCNGKCQMMKKLDEQEKKESQTGIRSFNDEIISSKSFFASVGFHTAGSVAVYNRFSAEHPTNMPRTIFHPPGA